jgi:hypothetical protein
MPHQQAAGWIKRKERKNENEENGKEDGKGHRKELERS